VYADKPKVLKDSTPYNSLLPIFGKKVKELGFDLPYSGGLSVNYLWQKSEISISNVNVGFNNSPLYDVDELILIVQLPNQMVLIFVRISGFFLF
jgi:hypothetical protein